MAARCGIFWGLIRLAIASTSSRVSLPREVDERDDTAFSGAVRPCRDRPLAPRVRGLPRNFFRAARRPEADLVFPAIRLFHDIDVQLKIPIENRSARLERFYPNASACCHDGCDKILSKESAHFDAATLYGRGVALLANQIRNTPQATPSALLPPSPSTRIVLPAGVRR